MAAPVHALVVADGDVDAALLAELAAAEPVPLLIGADGGAARIRAAGLLPDLVVGDLDSLDDAERDRLVARGIELRVSAPDKDESDMELALLAAIDAGAERVTILGALGLVRPEHSVANLLLLADPRLEGIDITLVGRGSRISCSGSASGPGAAEVRGEPGDFVSLLPLAGMVEGVTTDGLRFPLADETLVVGPARGLSNELVAPTAHVISRRGCLLVIHTSRSMADVPPRGDL